MTTKALVVIIILPSDEQYGSSSSKTLIHGDGSLLGEIANRGCSGVVRLFVGKDSSVLLSTIMQSDSTLSRPPQQRERMNIRVIDATTRVKDDVWMQEEMAEWSGNQDPPHCLVVIISASLNSLPSAIIETINNNKDSPNNQPSSQHNNGSINGNNNTNGGGVLINILVAGNFGRPAATPFKSLLRLPRQSWRFLDGQEHPQAGCSDQWLPMMCTQYHPVLTRRDLCQHWSPEECCTRGGLGEMQWEHFLREIAYKLGLADKYGA